MKTIKRFLLPVLTGIISSVIPSVLGFKIDTWQYWWIALPIISISIGDKSIAPSLPCLRTFFSISAKIYSFVMALLFVTTKCVQRLHACRALSYA